MNSIDKEIPAVRHLARILERELDVFVSANCYMSWGTTHGLDLHWDDHDTFVVQVHGRKHWSIYGSTRLYPLHDDVEQPARPHEPALEEVVLTVGDALYVPRGCWHDVTALQEPSLHITFSLIDASGADFLMWAVDQVKSEVLVRKPLPKSRSRTVSEKYLVEIRTAVLGGLTQAAFDRYVKERRQELPEEKLPSLPEIADVHQ